MKRKTVFDAMKCYIEKSLTGVPLELLAVSEEEKKDEETANVNRFIRCEVEVPRGFDELSRCRFTVKIPDAKLQVREEDLENFEVFVIFKGLSISYVDSRGAVYFRAESYTITKEGE